LRHVNITNHYYHHQKVSALAFSNASNLLLVIGADDKHVVTLFDLTEAGGQSGTEPAFLEDQPGQVGTPPQVCVCVCVFIYQVPLALCFWLYLWRLLSLAVVYYAATFLF
jgi:hypothetical protein